MAAQNGFSAFRTLFRSLLFLARNLHEFLLIAIPLVAIDIAAASALGYLWSGGHFVGFWMLVLHPFLPGIVTWVLIAIFAVRWHRLVLLGRVDGLRRYIPTIGRRERTFLKVNFSPSPSWCSSSGCWAASYP